MDAATDGKRVKPTKTRNERDVAVDAETVEMALRHCAEMDERAAWRSTTRTAAAAPTASAAWSTTAEILWSLRPDADESAPDGHGRAEE